MSSIVTPYPPEMMKLPEHELDEQHNEDGFNLEKPAQSLAKVPTPPKSPDLAFSTPNPSLFSQSAVAKIWGIALKGLEKSDPPTEYPEYTNQETSKYVYTSIDFWTSGFFPGSLYLLYERRRKWNHSPTISNFPQLNTLKLKHACKWWTDGLHAEASRSDTHDLGFMVMPWAQIGWELDQDEDCYRSMIAAAYALASRYDERVGAIRSWDRCATKRYTYTDPKNEFLVIIDSLMNLNLLFYVSKLVGNPSLARIAHNHAAKILGSHVREDNSTVHVVDFNQHSGAAIKRRFTNQGFSDESCWSRGQAWGITGYVQTYGWTKNPQFLDASQRLADYFIERLPQDNVPYWDFDAPKSGPRDTSAALIAAYGMLLLHQHFQSETSRYLMTAMHIIDGVVGLSMAPEARFGTQEDQKEIVEFDGAETIVLNATINNNDYAPRRWADHGLVYADYYFLLIGNTLAEMGLV